MSDTPHRNGEISIDDFDAADEAIMEIIAPLNGLKLGSITFAGPGHPKTIQMSNAVTRRRLYEDRQRAVNNRWKPPEKSPEELANENVQFIVDRILRWDGVKLRGTEGVVEDIPFTEDAAVKLLIDPRRGWLFGQCVEFLTNTDAFFRDHSP